MIKKCIKSCHLFTCLFLFIQGLLVAQPAVTNDNLTLTVQSGLTVTVSGAFTNQNSGAIANAGTITATGNWTNNVSNSVFTTSAGTVQLLGTSAQTIGGTYATSFYNLTLANTSSTSPQYILGSNQTVKNALTMTSGNTNLASCILTIGTASTTPGSLSYTSGWLYGGTLKRWYNTTTVANGSATGLFPMGGASDTRPFYITAPTTAPTTGGTISVTHTAISGITNVLFTDVNVRIDRRFNSKWAVSTSDGLAGGTYNLRADGTGFSGVSAVNILRLTLDTTSLASYGTNAGTTTNPQVNRTGLTLSQLTNTFYISYPTSPLPIELVSFEVSAIQQEVIANWITASEINSDYFILQRSSNNLDFEDVLTIDAAGNSTEILAYQGTDSNPLPGLSYYRLKEKDLNGYANFSAVKAVNFEMNNSDLEIASVFFLNQAFTITVLSGKSKPFTLNFYDASGRLICQKSGKLLQGANALTIPLVNAIESLYVVSLTCANKQVSKKISLIKMD